MKPAIGTIALVFGVVVSSLVSPILTHGQTAQSDAAPAVPIATQWTLQAVPLAQETTVKSVLLIECRKAGIKGTAFLEMISFRHSLNLHDLSLG
jgi:hypothetical protein